MSLVMGGGAAIFGGVVTAAGLGLASASGRVLDAKVAVLFWVAVPLAAGVVRTLRRDVT